MALPVDPDESVLGDGDVAPVTGSTSGIGREVAHNLASVGATVLVHGRDRERARDVVDSLPGDGHEWHLADFADLDEVRDLAATVRDEYDRLDCLVNNAGTWQGERRLVDVPGTRGVELTFAVNHLAPFLLTHELLDHMAETAGRRTDERAAAHARDADSETGDDSDSTGDEAAVTPARVVNVSSAVHRRASFDLSSVEGPDGPSGVDAYGFSKLATVMFTYELARRSPEGVTATCCHPGAVPATRLARDGSLLSGLGWRLFGLVGKVVDVTETVEAAARTPTYLACSPEVTGVGGKYYEDSARTHPSEAASDREAQRELWETSLAWTGLAEEPEPEATA